MTDEVTRHDPVTCPACGADYLRVSQKIHDDGTGGGPEPGSYTICGECAAFLRFGPGLTLEKSEVPAETTDRERWIIRKAQQQIRRKKP